MGPLAAAAINVGASLLSGALSKGPSIAEQNTEDYNYKRRLEGDRYKWLVSGAQKAGFNPLTVLGATGGQMAQTSRATPPLSDKQIMGNALKDGANAYLSYDPIDEASRELDNDLKRARLDQINNEQTRLGQSVPQVRETASPVQENYGSPVGTPNVRPHAKPHPGNQPRIPVRLPNGAEAGLLKNVADRYGISNWDTLVAGDIAELGGEALEVGNLLQVDTILKNLLDVGIMEDRTPRQKRRDMRERDRKLTPDERVENISP